MNFLNGSDNENSKFATKNWYIIDSESKGNYLPDNEIKFLTRSLESSLWEYSAGVSVEAGDRQFSPTIEPQMTWKSPGINP